VKPALVIGDENPMREPERWRVMAAQKLGVPLWTVDSDVIVPSHMIEKEQYAAFHIRRKLDAQLDRFLTKSANRTARVKWRARAGLQSLSLDTDITEGWPLNRDVGPVSTFKGGSKEAMRLLREFTQNKLAHYAQRRNHPELDGTSRLSPYLHFGHISTLTVALAVRSADVPREQKESFLSELLVWRELAVNFVRHNPNYDNFESGEKWAHRTLAEHAQDLRPYLYSQRQLDAAETHDALWNAAQRQMVTGGWMHNYMRMYWGKKILEWSRTPEEALATMIHLHDRYALDGQDPNTYANILWCFGLHDRPWPERPVYGSVRSMSRAGMDRKTDVAAYLEEIARLERSGGEAA